MNKITVTIEVDNSDDLREISRLPDYTALVFHLRHNFHRQFANIHEESEDFHRGVEKVLDELQETINEHLYEN